MRRNVGEANRLALDRPRRSRVGIARRRERTTAPAPIERERREATNPNDEAVDPVQVSSRQRFQTGSVDVTCTASMPANPGHRVDERFELAVLAERPAGLPFDLLREIDRRGRSVDADARARGCPAEIESPARRWADRRPPERQRRAPMLCRCSAALSPGCRGRSETRIVPKRRSVEFRVVDGDRFALCSSRDERESTTCRRQRLPESTTRMGRRAISRRNRLLREGRQKYPRRTSRSRSVKWLEKTIAQRAASVRTRAPALRPTSRPKSVCTTCAPPDAASGRCSRTLAIPRPRPRLLRRVKRAADGDRRRTRCDDRPAAVGSER